LSLNPRLIQRFLKTAPAENAALKFEDKIGDGSAHRSKSS
jgi:hypothetical protein